MRNFTIICSLILLIACNNKNKPNIDAIQLNVDVMRFDRDFFAIDTSNVANSIIALEKKYNSFTRDFIVEILGLNMDSVRAGEESNTIAIKNFIHDYQPVKAEAEKEFKDFNSLSKEIVTGLRYVKHYFPDYRTPDSIITFIGPFDANFQTSFGIQGDILTTQGLGIALQFHLGKKSSIYETPAIRALYPEFIIANFDPAHISVNCFRNIVDDLYQDNSAGRPLIEQMVEKGKRLYLLTRFLPGKDEAVLIGYSKDQYKAARKNEGVIWSFFLSNDLLNVSDVSIIKNYIGESPKTAEFGDQAPGNLGSFAGLQIVKKYMDKFEETSLQELIVTDPRKVYMLSKYKPAP